MIDTNGDFDEKNSYFSFPSCGLAPFPFGPDHDIGRGVADAFGSGMKDGKSFMEIYEKHINLMNELVYDYMLPNFDYMYENYYSRFED